MKGGDVNFPFSNLNQMKLILDFKLSSKSKGFRADYFLTTNSKISEYEHISLKKYVIQKWHYNIEHKGDP